MNARSKAARSIRRRLVQAALLTVIDNQSAKVVDQLRHEGSRFDESAVSINVRSLKGVDIKLRPNTSDATLFVEAFLRHLHLPPRGWVKEPVRTVVDLGANIGLTSADFAARFPAARIYAVEMDPANAALARENVSSWSDRCTVVEAAVWPIAGTVSYSLTAGEEWSAAVGPGPFASPTVSIADLFQQTGRIDYLKMDIEGSEEAVLGTDVEWASMVRCMRIETHPPFDAARCSERLRALGFRTRIDRRHQMFVDARSDPD